MQLQFTEPPEKYYSKIWGLPKEVIKDFVSVYDLNHEIWKFKNFKSWFWRSYRFKFTYKQFRWFERYYKTFLKRKELKLSSKVKITKEFIEK